MIKGSFRYYNFYCVGLMAELLVAIGIVQTIHGSRVSEGKSSGRVAECTRPNPKIRRGPKRLLVWRIWDEHKRTRGIIVVQAIGA
jgi:hypothetical protein